MIIAEVDLNKNVTIVTSTPDNKPEVGKILQQVTVQAEKAEAAGRKVFWELMATSILRKMIFGFLVGYSTKTV